MVSEEWLQELENKCDAVVLAFKTMDEHVDTLADLEMTEADLEDACSLILIRTDRMKQQILTN